MPAPTGRDTCGAWREGAHDDLILSVALACWAGELSLPGRTRLPPPGAAARAWAGPSPAAQAGARFLTERELVRERASPLPPRLRHGAAGMRYRPDGCVVLPTGERISVEAEPQAKVDGRLGAKLRWYRDEARYDEVLWLVPSAAVEESLWAAIAAADPEAELMAIERLPAALLRYAGG